MRRMKGEEVGGKDCNALALRMTAPESINRERLALEGKLDGRKFKRRSRLKGDAGASGESAKRAGGGRLSGAEGAC